MFAKAKYKAFLSNYISLVLSMPKSPNNQITKSPNFYQKKHGLNNHCENTHHDALTEDRLNSVKSMISEEK